MWCEDLPLLDQNRFCCLAAQEYRNEGALTGWTSWQAFQALTSGCRKASRQGDSLLDQALCGFGERICQRKERAQYGAEPEPLPWLEGKAEAHGCVVASFPPPGRSDRALDQI